MKKLILLIMVVALAVSVAAPPVSATEYDPGVPRPKINATSTKIKAETEDIGWNDPEQVGPITDSAWQRMLNWIHWVFEIVGNTQCQPSDGGSNGEECRSNGV